MADGIAGFLNGIATPTTQSQSTQYPLWLQSALESIAGAAGNLAQQEYQTFPGPQVAAPSANTQKSWDMAGANVGNWEPALNQARDLTTQAASPITSGDISQFINPYEKYITGALNRNLQDNMLPGIQDKFVGAGQSRSPQEAMITGRAIYDTQQAAGEALGGVYQGAVDSLLRSRQIQSGAGAQMGQLGALNSQLGAADVGSIAAAGTGQDQLAQTNINAALNNFSQQQRHPYEQLGFLSNIINRIPIAATGPVTNSTTTDYSKMGPSPLQTFAGSYLGGQSLGLARGGAVRPPARYGVLESMRVAA